jgi:PadR family transcriptional regulator PadR
MKFDKELLKGNIATLILSMLKRKPMYGYELIREASLRTDNVFTLKEGTLYPALHALERKGYIVSRWEAGDSGKKRKYYMLTRKGMAFVAEKQQEWFQFSWAVNAIIGGASTEP